MSPFSKYSGPYYPILWARRNKWFRNHSSLAGALGEQENQEAFPSSFVPPPSGVPGGHQEHNCAPVPFNGSRGSLDRPVLEVTVQGNKNTDSRTVAGLRGGVPFFCRVGNCRYWHTEVKQVKRHRNTHFRNRYTFVCPNQATCPSQGSKFRRRDAVNAHCKRFQACGDMLEANNRVILLQGTPATEKDLRPQDPNFHIPYERFDGRTRRRGGKGW